MADAGKTREELQLLIKDQGQIVRTLKTEKAPNDQVYYSLIQLFDKNSILNS